MPAAGKGTQQRSSQQQRQRPAGPSIPRPEADWTVPERYTVQSIIGAGSYGHVCEALDRVENRVVAIKKIHRVFEDLVDCKRILREIAILNRLHHENIVKTCDICVPTDLNNFNELYLVLEIADSDFKKLFKTQVYLKEEHIQILLYNLLVGVRYIHSAGIYHRDLKPANCLVNHDCSVKICDFGLARTIDEKAEKDVARLSAKSEPENLAPGIPHTQNMRRQLTGHVVTRWYRAPELILLQQVYTEAIDLWSIGCVFAELLGMMQSNVSLTYDRGPIFPGSSCFPLSPDQKTQSNDYNKFNSRSNKDQLNVIFNVLGTPSEEDIESLQKDDAKRYIRIFTAREGVDFKKLFPGASTQALELLTGMLMFNPNKRITIEEALRSPFFERVRVAGREVVAKERVILPFDDWEPMTEQELRYAFLKEVQRFHPEVEIPKALEENGYGAATKSRHPENAA